MNVNANRCPANHPCPARRVCPVGAISQRANGLPSIDEGKCVKCGKCAEACPMRAITE